MNPDEIAKLQARLAALGTPERAPPAETIRELFESIHAAKSRGVANVTIAKEIGLEPNILSVGYRREAARRGVKPVKRSKSLSTHSKD
jgi:hypothetical protein